MIAAVAATQKKAPSRRGIDNIEAAGVALGIGTA